MKEKKPSGSDKSGDKPVLKPKHPKTKGAPDNQDPEAQYEEKDES